MVMTREVGGAPVNKTDQRLMTWQRINTLYANCLYWRKNNQHFARVSFSSRSHAFILFSFPHQFPIISIVHFTACSATVWPVGGSRSKEATLDSRGSLGLGSKQVCDWLVEEAAGKLDMLLNTTEDFSPLLLLLLLLPLLFIAVFLPGLFWRGVCLFVQTPLRFTDILAVFIGRLLTHSVLVCPYTPPSPPSLSITTTLNKILVSAVFIQFCFYFFLWAFQYL